MPNRSVLIIGSVWPEPNSSAAGQRMMQLIRLFKSQGYQIIFASTAEKGSYTANLQSLGIKQKRIKINDSSFDAFLKELHPDIVMFDRFLVEEQFGWRVTEVCPSAVRILDTEDLHCLRRCRKKTVQKNRTFAKQDLLSEEVTKREIASIYRCDLSLIISEYEVDLLQNFFGIDGAFIQYLPYVLKSIKQSRIDALPSFDERTNFVTIGNFRHPPNWDAVQYLKSDIWPLIRRELPQTQLHVYGAYPSQKVWNLHQPEEGFHIKGRADNARTVIQQAKVSLAPLRFGAGLKGKLVESMKWGTPSVTSSVGAEGISINKRWGGTVANDVSTMVSAAVKLYSDKAIWKQDQCQGFQIYNQRFANHDYSSAFLDKLQAIEDSIEEHRCNNFIGQMLQYHTNKSTKYMSKWIEEKNKA